MALRARACYTPAQAHALAQAAEICGAPRWRAGMLLCVAHLPYTCPLCGPLPCTSPIGEVPCDHCPDKPAKLPDGQWPYKFNDPKPSNWKPSDDKRPSTNRKCAPVSPYRPADNSKTSTGGGSSAWAVATATASSTSGSSSASASATSPSTSPSAPSPPWASANYAWINWGTKLAETLFDTATGWMGMRWGQGAGDGAGAVLGARPAVQQPLQSRPGLHEAATWEECSADPLCCLQPHRRTDHRWLHPPFFHPQQEHAALAHQGHRGQGRPVRRRVGLRHDVLQDGHRRPQWQEAHQLQGGAGKGGGTRMRAGCRERLLNASPDRQAAHPPRCALLLPHRCSW